MSRRINNPILPGFYPDPSIVRVEEDFYLVTSSFSFYPGVPIFKSRDLVNWNQIGHVLERPSQLPLNADYISAGIFAPTIRYHKGIFYMITTNVDHGGNFICTAENPAGPWSEPHWLKGAEGIDPSLFFDEDGRAYCCGAYGGKEGKIWLCEIDLQEFKLVGEVYYLWGGSQLNARSPEAPHIYRRNGYYYLMIAEGGTEHYHAVTICRSKCITGPYVNYDGNPILTHRHFGMNHPIANVGHGDLVECQDGSWYMVALGSRPYGGYHKNMGRETFLMPVTWENDWPVVSPGTGKIEWTYEAPGFAGQQDKQELPLSDCEGFGREKLSYQWNFLGTPYEGLYRIEKGRLHLRLDKHPLEPQPKMPATERAEQPESEPGGQPESQLGGIIKAAGFVGRRQQHMDYSAETKLVFSPQEGEKAGLILLQNNFHSLRIELGREAEGLTIKAIKGYKSLEISLIILEEEGEYQKEVLGKVPWKSESAILRITAKGQSHTLSVVDENGKESILAENVDGSFLGSETASGFIGAYLGMYAIAGSTTGEKYAEFEYFKYLGS